MKLARRKHAIRAALIAGMDDLTVELITRWKYRVSCWHELVWLSGESCVNIWNRCPANTAACAVNAHGLQLLRRFPHLTSSHCDVGRACKFWKKTHGK